MVFEVSHIRHDIDEIPDHFISGRWRQGANTYCSLFNTDGTRATGRGDFEALRATTLNRVSTEFVSTCSHSDDYKYAMEMYKVMFLEVERRVEARKDKSEPTPDLVMDDYPLVDPKQILLLNPNVSQTKGRQTNAERLKRGIEKTKSGNGGCQRYKATEWVYEGHNWRNCEFNPNSKRNRIHANSMPSLRSFDVGVSNITCHGPVDCEGGL